MARVERIALWACVVWVLALLLTSVLGCAAPAGPAPADAVEADAGAGPDARDLCATCCLPSNQDSANCCELLDAGAASCGWSR